MKDFVALRPKLCSYKTIEGKIEKKVKRIKKI